MEGGGAEGAAGDPAASALRLSGSGGRGGAWGAGVDGAAGGGRGIFGYLRAGLCQSRGTDRGMELSRPGNDVRSGGGICLHDRQTAARMLAAGGGSRGDGGAADFGGRGADLCELPLHGGMGRGGAAVADGAALLGGRPAGRGFGDGTPRLGMGYADGHGDGVRGGPADGEAYGRPAVWMSERRVWELRWLACASHPSLCSGCIRSFVRWRLPIEAQCGVALFQLAIASEHSISIRQGDSGTARMFGDEDGFRCEQRGGGFGQQVEGLRVGGCVFPGRVKVNQGEVLLTAGECSQGDRNAALLELEIIVDAERGEISAQRGNCVGGAFDEGNVRGAAAQRL